MSSSFTITPPNGSLLPTATPNVVYNSTIIVTANGLLNQIFNGTLESVLPQGMIAQFFYVNNNTVMNVVISGTPTDSDANMQFNIIISFDVINQYIPFPEHVIVTYTLIVGPSENPPCIPNGQKILTPNGYKLIETLKTGDSIVTSDGRSVKIKMFSFPIPFVIESNAPILIPANTFSKNFPVNDVILSPQHLILIKPGVWELPRHLINKYSVIKRIKLGESITYYNIVTPNYLTDDLVVEGSIVESYGKNFAEKYPGERQYYKYNNELKGYTRITMQDVLNETKIKSSLIH